MNHKKKNNNAELVIAAILKDKEIDSQASVVSKLKKNYAYLQDLPNEDLKLLAQFVAIKGKVDLCFNGITFYSIDLALERASKLDFQKILAEFGYFVFGDSAGPTVFGISETGQVFEFSIGIINWKERFAYVGDEKMPLNKKNIERSCKRSWKSLDDFSKSVLNKDIIGK